MVIEFTYAARTIVVYSVVLIIALAIFISIKLRQSGSPSNSPIIPPSQGIKDQLESQYPWYIVFVVVFISLRVISRRHRGAALWKSNFSLQQPRTMTFDDEGIESISTIESVRWKWPTFCNWAETSEMFALRLPNKSVLIIPKRAASEAQQEELRESFRVRIAVPTGAFSVKLHLPIADKSA
jgi:hypothetical protein